MSKAFISHSGKDKSYYVDIVVRNLQKDNIIYDTLTFEAGMPTLNEIEDGLKKSNLFVIFLSENSLEADFVKYELREAKRLLDEKLLDNIYPVIIDKSINHEDKRIPDWMRDKYNIKYVSRPSIIARRIQTYLRIITWNEHPRLKEREELFTGRNLFVNTIEESINLSEEKPFVIVLSGINKIGRKALMHYTFKKTNLYRPAYKPSIIELDTHESVEDFILKLFDLGFSTKIAIDDLMDKEKEEKVYILAELIKDIRDNNERIFINDNGCIITPERTIVDWFAKLLEKLNGFDWITMGVASKFRPLEHECFKHSNLFMCHVPELSSKDRMMLLKTYSDFEKLKMSGEDLKFFSQYLNGYPEQVFFTVKLIKEFGIVIAKNKTEIIEDFNVEKVTSVVSEYENDEKAEGLLVLLSRFECIHYNVLFEIVEEDPDVDIYIQKFLSKGICENVGVNYEYLRLNDVVRDYIRRSSLKLSEKYEIRIKKHVENFLNDLDIEDRDVSDFQFSLKEALLSGKYEEVKHLLIPSNFLHTMKELYDINKKCDDVIMLADRVLESEAYIDVRMQLEIRYYLCLSLARNRDERFKKEVMKIAGAEHDFLFGFYYRQIGDYEKAIERYESAVNKKEKFARAQRELVQVYLILEDYEKALELARENYENDKKRNPYHVQAYFTCLIKQPRSEENIMKIRMLINDLKEIKTEKGIEMYLRCLAQYYAFIEEDKKMAIETIDKAIISIKQNFFAKVDKFYICHKFHELEAMNDIIEEFKGIPISGKSYFYNYITKIQAFKLAYDNNYEGAIKLISNMKHYPKGAKERLINKIAEICATLAK